MRITKAGLTRRAGGGCRTFEATGGTACAAVQLLRSLGAEILAACFIVDLPDLGGSAALAKLEVPVRYLVSFAGH